MTQQSKFTPGPWETAPGYYGEGATANTIKSPGGKVAHLDVVMWANGDNEDVLRMKANARLIAQAPEMYELLSHITNHDPLLPCGFCINEARRIKAEIDGE